MSNNNRSINPWVGHPSKSKESRSFGGYIYYYQLRYFDGTNNKNKKFYYEQGDDKSEEEALKKANLFRVILN